MPLLLGNRQIFRGMGASCLQFTLKQFRKSMCGGRERRELERGQANMVKCLHRGLGEWHQEFLVQSLQIFPKPEITSK